MDTQPPASAPEPIVPPSVRQLLLDSAVILGGLAAISYATGYLAHARDAQELGLSVHLLPEKTTEGLILAGALVLILDVVAFLGVYFFLLLGSRWVDQSTREGWVQGAKTRLALHPRLYPTIGILCGIPAVVVLSVDIKAAFGPGGPYADKRLSKVAELKTKTVSVGVDPNSLLFLAKRDGWVILKQSGEKQYVVLPQDEVTALRLKEPG